MCFDVYNTFLKLLLSKVSFSMLVLYPFNAFYLIKLLLRIFFQVIKAKTNRFTSTLLFINSEWFPIFIYYIWFQTQVRTRFLRLRYYMLILPPPTIRISLLSGFKRIAISPALNENILSDKILSLLLSNFCIFTDLI